MVPSGALPLEIAALGSLGVGLCAALLLCSHEIHRSCAGRRVGMRSVLVPTAVQQQANGS